MINIRPVTDLRNNFAEISKEVHEQQSTIFFTKNGYGDMVVMSIEQYSKLIEDKIVLQKLEVASKEASSISERFDFNDVNNEMRQRLLEKISKK
ncbi:MAG: type II toxin-antitoxin system Phd/YefM family antitoxin [Clostridia bacterium]|nr:type II toxin-antitoxin system Phd/YefM family antitoxin [Clostridia bacterium]